ncbi:hypothetical protein Pcinc_037562 [Petrolisthes cinctipes]|uniref:Innexin n=1 Tax=Petrolisthes cinctipes TaxID=88211 RepID=A0AAE1BW97_PETCI|nr:hypothetical protein Pcinc_037562 [Petrolisthes cinctipes]
MWKNWEGGKIHALMMDLDVGICSEVEKKQKKKLLLDYLADNLKHHNWWAYRYFFCELLAFLNVVASYPWYDWLVDVALRGGGESGCNSSSSSSSSSRC